MSKIKSLKALEIIDSRGNPTVEVVCELESGITRKASVPSGASTGKYEAVELRDKDEKRYGGKGVLKAVKNVNGEINNKLCGALHDQKSLDHALIALDGTPNKARLGANAILGVSLAFAKCIATYEKKELFQYLGNIAGVSDFKMPIPMLNVINGGKHADSGLDIQEFMIGPVGFKTFREKIQAAAEIIGALRTILQEKKYTISVGDEGGFAPQLSSNEEAFELLIKAIIKAGYSEENVKIGIDAAASSFFEDNAYQITVEGKKIPMTSEDMISWYEKMIDKYPVISIEDGLEEEDWNGFTEMTKRLGDKIKIVGDDLLVTNTERIKTAIENKSVNSVLIKLNQIGTLTETIEAILLTKKQGWAPFVSHRSGETVDTFISDLAVGLSCEFIKAGSLVRGERVAKYNRLLEIENILSKTN